MKRSINYLLPIVLIVFTGCDPEQESDCGRVCFELSGQEFSTQNTYQIVLGDVDGDGNLDVLVTNFGHPNEIWLGDGAGGFSDSGLRLSGDANNSGAALGDLDGDGDLDIFLAHFVGGANEIWFNETLWGGI